MPIRVFTGTAGAKQLFASFRKNRVHYLQEALGLAIFMISACLFSAMLENRQSSWHQAIPNAMLRNIIIAVMMGTTALFIFYSPFTSPSGSHINPAVTLSFLRLGKICHWDALFYILFQLAGGTAAVYTMQLLLGDALTEPPVNSAVTVPGKAGIWPAFFMEFTIAFITMSMVLFTGADARFKKYTRIIASCLVFAYVLIAGPVSGFGMNPARSFASALPAHTWTAAWIYLLVPIAGMLGAAEFFLWMNRRQIRKMSKKKRLSNTKM